jgi:hypothetical protein
LLEQLHWGEEVSPYHHKYQPAVVTDIVCLRERIQQVRHHSIFS